MTEQELELLLRVWQERLRLDRWDLRLRFDLPVDGENEAEIKIHDYYEQGSIRISPEFGEWSSEWAESVIVHELVHVYEKSVRRAADAVCEALPSSTREVYWAWYLFASEQMVEGLSQAFLTLSGAALPSAPLAKK